MSDRWTLGKYVSHSSYGEVIVIYNSDKASDKMEVICASRVKRWVRSAEDSEVHGFKVSAPNHKVIRDSDIDPFQIPLVPKENNIELGNMGTGTGINLCYGTGRESVTMGEYFSDVVSLDVSEEAAIECIECGDELARRPDIISSLLTWDYHK